jgi:hypothetical protein
MGLVVLTAGSVRAQLYPMPVRETGTTVVPGAVGSSARHFDPTDSIDFGDHFGFTPNQPFSVTFWFKMDSDQGAMGQFVGWQAEDSGWNVDTGYMVPGDQPYICFNVCRESAGNDGIGIRNEVNYAGDGLWHQVACTYNGNGHTSGMKMYIDGSAVSTVVIQEYDLSNVTAYPHYYNRHFRLGQSLDYAGSPDGDGLKGSLDEVCLYNVELSSSVVSGLYTYQLNNQEPHVTAGIVREIDFEKPRVTIDASSQVSQASVDVNATDSRMVLTIVTSAASQQSYSDYLTINFAPTYEDISSVTARPLTNSVYPVFSQYGTNSLNGIARFGLTGTSNSIVVSTMGIAPSANTTYQFVINSAR